MTAPQANAYDEFPYESKPFEGTHPNRLAAIGRLYGLRTAPPDRCRVLELGCAGGGNLLPMAAYLPGSEFVGVDLSAVQIEAAQRAAEMARLANVRFHAMSIADITPDFGRFDYVIAHGVYSWVPASVRDRLLAVCAANLAPDGVAYVSYNTYPGWHARGMVRDMLRYRTDRFQTAREKVVQARALMDFLRRASSAADNAFGMALREEIDALQRSPDFYLAHEHLEEDNAPVHFHEFVDAARQHELQYLNDVDVRTKLLNDFAPEIRSQLLELAANPIELEQYIDFVRERTFRRSLLVHRAVNLQRGQEAHRLQELFVTFLGAPVSANPDLRSPGTSETFRDTAGVSIAATNPLTKTALSLLADSAPQPLHFSQLRDLALERLAGDTRTRARIWQENGAGLCNDVLGCCTAGLAWLCVQAQPPTQLPPTRPHVNAFTRQHGASATWIVNRLHQLVELDEFTRHLIQLMDGTRDLSALREAMCKQVADGALEYMHNGVAVTDPQLILQAVNGAMASALPRIARAAVLDTD
jgi:methyltransferase-like protein